MAVRIGAVWRVTGLPMLLNCNEAIVALTLTEWLLSGRDADSPCTVAWREELNGA